MSDEDDVEVASRKEEEEILEIERSDNRDREDEDNNRFNNQMASLDADLARSAVDRPGRDADDKPRTRYPDHFEERYFTREGRDEVTVYADSRGEKELFRDAGDKLRTKQASELAVKAMIETAQHREWRSMNVRGSNDFKREVWLEARARGIEVKGYKPTELDMQELKNREQRFLNNEVTHEQTPTKNDQTTHERGETRSGMPERDAKEQTKRDLVEAVIERDLRKQFHDNPEQIATEMDRARRSLDRREARGDKLPELKVRETREVTIVKEQSPQDISMDQIKQNVKRQEQDRDVEKTR